MSAGLYHIWTSLRLAVFLPRLIAANFLSMTRQTLSFHRHLYLNRHPYFYHYLNFYRYLHIPRFLHFHFHRRIYIYLYRTSSIAKQNFSYIVLSVPAAWNNPACGNLSVSAT